VQEFNVLIESREYEHDIPKHVVRKIHQMADQNRDNRIDFNEFVDMVNNPDLQYFFGHYVTRYVQLVVPRRPTTATTEIDGLYEEQYSCYPPAVGMIILSLIEIIFFAWMKQSKRIRPDQPQDLSVQYLFMILTSALKFGGS
jgi:rhomboid-related protein 1/2/3